jgi:hypothetical protein
MPAQCGHAPTRCLAPRRKKKAVHKVSTTDDKRLQTTLKRLGVNTIPGIEEVNLFQDNDVIHFTNPKGKRTAAPVPAASLALGLHAWCANHVTTQGQQRTAAGPLPHAWCEGWTRSCRYQG